MADKVSINLLLATRRTGDISVQVSLDSATPVGSIHSACISAVSAQVPEHAGRPIVEIGYDPRSNR